ncbi:adenosylmethionine decarboxylase [Solimicrobium silvestre]|uniref:S-adenosylmethionine decarboxylase proenzyme n=1 Tax=Solimicrobium silvestre TaxID=2099400 RepID=A0A2S9H409_9BURK|nr:adenosylmethionine decarboxylase [Solimicrobium silvestre]PRC94691.1 S-adenosylmethionine decarboxylase proenzyme [Solimicrobium silvestre]
MTHPVYEPSGQHLFADLYGINPDKLNDAATVELLLRESANAAGATILCSHFHAFGSGQGVTGVVLLAESHISIHTWPEFGFAAVDIFMCGNSKPDRALDVIQSALQASKSSVQTISRGHAPTIQSNR